MRLQPGAQMISLIIADDDRQILTVSENGYGKRTDTSQFPVKGRATQGVIGLKTSERNGPVVGAVQVTENDEIMLISDKGTLVRTRVDEISKVSRSAQGVTLINLKEGEKLVGLEQIDESEDVMDASEEPPPADQTH